MASKKFSDLPPMQQGLMLAVLPVALAIVVFYNFAMPLRRQAAQLKSKVAALHAQNMRGRMLEAQHVQLQQRITQAQTELATLREIVPDQPAHDEFVRMLYSTARASSVYIRDLQASPASRKTYFTEMPFSAHLDGTYYAMLEFFTRLAGNQRIVNVSGLSLTSAAASGAGGSYKTGPQETVAANCVLTTFYNSPPPAPASPKRGAGR